MPAGRPSSYDPEYARQAVKLCELGATDADLADFFEVSIVTINAWKQKHPEFLKSLKIGKEIPDDRVERSLYNRAVGYTYESVKIFNGVQGVVTVPYLEHVPPDPTSCFFWLKNRRQDEWREKQTVDQTVKSDVSGTLSIAHLNPVDAMEAYANAIRKSRE